MKFPGRFFKQVVGDALEKGDLDIEVRCLGMRHENDPMWPEQFWFRNLQEFEKAWVEIEDRNLSGFDIHYTVLARRREFHGKKEHPLPEPLLVCCLWADLDVGEGKPHKSKNDAALRIRDAGPTPNIIVESGSGLHAYWLIRAREVAKDRLERLLRCISEKLDGDMGAARATRLMRAPNTYNWKYGKNGKRVRIVYLSETRYRFRELERLWKVGEESRKSEQQMNHQTPTFSTFFSTHLRKLVARGIEATALCPFHHDTNPSLTVNLSTGLWKCHSNRCTARGNLKQFCRRLGVSLPKDAGTRRFPRLRAPSKHPPGDHERLSKRSQATKLMVALPPDVKFFHTSDEEPYITLSIDGHAETYRLRDSHTKRWLARCFFERFEAAPSSQTLNDALNLLEAKAMFDGPEADVFTRVAEWRGTVLLDLCNACWQAVQITAEGWKVVDNPPVNFRRARGMQSLPLPVRGGSIHELRPFLNVRSDDDFVLCVSWLVAALNTRGPFPLLVLQGEAGSAKSTAARVLRGLVDPNTTPLRSEPREIRDLMIAAKNSWCTAFDNVSHLPEWLSDALCSLATGGGFATRSLYTNDEEQLFQATRPILMNGIEGVVTRGDLLDRSLILDLPAITDQQRRPEVEFWRAFHEAHGRILGALLDAVSTALRNLENIRLNRLPRMADFARLATAAEAACDWPTGTFLSAYGANRASANMLTLEASSIVPPLRRLLATTAVWRGTAAELLKALNGKTDGEQEQRSWPKNPQVLSGQLRRIAPNLRATGLDLQFGEKTPGLRSKRIITIKRHMPEKPPDELTEAIVKEIQSEAQPKHIQRFPRLRGGHLRFPRLKSDADDARGAEPRKRRHIGWAS